MFIIFLYEKLIIIRKMKRCLREVVGFVLYCFARLFVRKPSLLSLYFHDPSPKVFGDVIEWCIRHKYAFIDLDVFYAIVVDGKKLPQKRVVFLSFDDGWRSNLQLLPVIEKYNVPITIFVSTASVCEGNYWWEYVLNLHGRDMVERMKMLPYDEFCEAVNGMKIRCTLDRSAVDETELQKLINHPLVSIQSHTVSHPILTNCPDAVLEYELSESKRFLEDKTKGDVIAFSYPNGDVGDREKNAVKKAGYKLAFTTQAHNIGLDTIDEFLIPRMAMNTWGGKYENFSKILGIWQKIIKNE